VRIEPSLAAFACSDVSVSNGALFVAGAGLTLPTDQGKVRAELQGAVNFFNPQKGLVRLRPRGNPLRRQSVRVWRA
jgi:hypothetical protein